MIIAENWSVTELSNIEDRIDHIFHFDMSPNKFLGFDDDSQVVLNKIVQKMAGEAA